MPKDEKLIKHIAPGDKMMIRKETLKGKPIKERMNYIYRIQKILRSALTDLYENNIPIDQYFNNNPFPKSQFSKSSNIILSN